MHACTFGISPTADISGQHQSGAVTLIGWGDNGQGGGYGGTPQNQSGGSQGGGYGGGQPQNQ